MQRLWTDLHDGVEDTSGLRTATRLAAFTNHSDAAIEAAEFAYRFGGGDALFTSSPLQRGMRDMRAASQHMQLSEGNYEGLGKLLIS